MIPVIEAKDMPISEFEEECDHLTFIKNYVIMKGEQRAVSL